MCRQSRLNIEARSAVRLANEALSIMRCATQLNTRQHVCTREPAVSTQVSRQVYSVGSAFLAMISRSTSSKPVVGDLILEWNQL